MPSKVGRPKREDKVRVFTAKMREEYVIRLKKTAIDEGISASALIEKLLDEYLTNKKE